MKWLGFLLAFFILSTTVFALNQYVDLKGIKTVNVMVADLSDDLVNDGVDKEALATDLELALRTAGLTVLMQGQYDDTVPTISLQVTAIKEPDGRFYRQERMSTNRRGWWYNAGAILLTCDRESIQ